MGQISEQDQRKVDVLTGEICILNELIAEEQDNAVAEEMRQERMLLIAQINNIYGTDHIVKGSKITVINNDLNTI